LLCDASLEEVIARLLSIGDEVLKALDEDVDTDGEAFMALLASHQQIMSEFKALSVEADTATIELMERLQDQVTRIIQGLRQRRDALAEQVIRARNRKRAFDAYRKI
jgi:oligoendopeptidase F